MFKIEHKIPMPKRRGGSRPAKYPFREMKVGDSFFVPDVKIYSFASQASLWGKKLGAKFSCLTVEGGVRVWRVK